MASLPQTQQRTYSGQDGRRRTAPVVPGTTEGSGSSRSRARQALPAVDPSTAFGCVDWFLYPDEAVGRSTAEAQVKRIQA